MKIIEKIRKYLYENILGNIIMFILVTIIVIFLANLNGNFLDHKDNNIILTKTIVDKIDNSSNQEVEKNNNTNIIDTIKKIESNKTPEKIEQTEEYSTDAYFDKYVFGDYKDIGVKIVKPENGYKTGLVDLPIIKWENQIIFEEKEKISIDINYPKFIGGKKVNKLNNYIKKTVDNFVEEDRQIFKNFTKKELERFTSILSLSIRYRIVGIQKEIISIELVTKDFTGGGNGNHDYPYIINWDLKSDKLLNSNKIFCKNNYLPIISSIARKKLIARIPDDFDLDANLDKDKENYNFVVDWIKGGTEPKQDNFDKLIPLKGGLLVIFPPYSVHSGASGIVRVYISKSEIPNLICLP